MPLHWRIGGHIQTLRLRARFRPPVRSLRGAIRHSENRCRGREVECFGNGGILQMILQQTVSA
jgi:hypothetical protein